MKQLLILGLVCLMFEVYAVDIKDYCLYDQERYELLSEYSGITINKENNFLVMIAEEDGLLVQTRQQFGSDDFISNLSIAGLGTCNGDDFEAIAFLFSQNQMHYYAALNEACNEVVILEINANHSSINEYRSFKIRHNVAGSDRLRSSEGDGLEGICYNAISGELFVVEEEEDGGGSAYYDKPGLYKLNNSFTRLNQLPSNGSTQSVTHVPESLSSNNLDYSGCFHLSNVDPSIQNEILIVSQQSEEIYQLNIVTGNYTSMSIADLSANQKLEGVCIFKGLLDASNPLDMSQMYITSDNGGSAGSYNTHYTFVKNLYNPLVDDQLVCSNLTKNITAQINGSAVDGGNLSYNWNPTNVINGSSSNLSANVQTTSPLNMTFQVQDGFCTLSHQFDVDIDVPADADFSYQLSGLQIQLTADDSDQTNYNWSINGSSIGNTSTLIYNVPASGNYTFNLQSSNSCGQTDNVSQTINIISPDYSYVQSNAGSNSQSYKVVHTDDNGSIGLTPIEPIRIIKYDLNGNQTWVKELSGNSAYQISEKPLDLIKCHNGDVILMGYSNGVVMRLNQDGDLLWGVVFPGEGYTGSVVEDVSGNAYVYSEDKLIKFDINGNIIWSYSNFPFDHNLNRGKKNLAISESENHLFLIGTEPGGISNLMKLNTSNGVEIWTKKFNSGVGNIESDLIDIRATKNGSNNLIVSAYPNLLLRINESGNLLSAKKIQLPGAANFGIVEFHCSSQHVYVGGSDVIHNLISWHPRFKYMTKLNYSLTAISSKRYYENDDLDFIEPYSFDILPDHSLLMTGIRTNLKTDISGNTCFGFESANITSTTFTGASFPNSNLSGITNSTNSYIPEYNTTPFSTQSISMQTTSCTNCSVDVSFNGNAIVSNPGINTSYINTSGGNNNFKWFINDQIISTSTNLNFSFPHIGTYLLRLEATNGNCISSKELYVEVGDLSKLFDAIPDIPDFNGCTNSHTLSISSSYDLLFDYLWVIHDIRPFPLISTSTVYGTENSVEITSSGTYTLWLREKAGFYSYTSQSINVNLSANCVVPGDLNADGIANARDVIQFGLAYNDTGTPRSDNNTDWQEYTATDWGENVNNGVDKKNVDADGNGIIDPRDYSVLVSNYSKVHDSPDQISAAPLTTSSLVTVSLIPVDVPTLDCSNSLKQIKFDVNVSNPELYGAYIEIDYDDNLAVLQNLRVEFADSWFGDINQTMYCVDQKDAVEEKFIIGISRIDHNGISGSGRFCTLVAEIDNTCEVDNIPLHFTISEAVFNKSNGEILPTIIEDYSVSNPMLTLISDDCVDDLTVYPGGQLDNITSAANTITSNGIIEINNGENKSFEANCIELNAGFNVYPGADFKAIINPCECDARDFIQLGAYTKPNQERIGIGVDMTSDGSIFAFTDADHDAISVYKNLNGVVYQMGQDITDNSSTSFGDDVVLSSDGERMVVQSYSDKKLQALELINSNWVAVGNPILYTEFGTKYDLSGDGNTLLIGSGNHDTNGLSNNGNIDIYSWQSNNWVWVQSLDGTSSNEYFGVSIAVSENGNRIAISNAVETRVYEKSNNIYTQLGSTILGISPSLTDSGYTVLVGHNSFYSSSVYTWNGTNWLQQGTTQTAPFSYQNRGLRISGDGSTYGFGRKANLQLYKWDGANWEATQWITRSSASYFGRMFRFSTDGNALVVGAFGDDAPGKIEYFKTDCY